MSASNGPRRDRLRHVQANAIAATCQAALDVALDSWQDDDGHERLDALITQALNAAVSLGLAD